MSMRMTLLVLLCLNARANPPEARMQITSSSFTHQGAIPAKYTCEGSDTSPPLAWTGVPSSAKSLALIVDDPDAPAKVWVHWTAWNIDPATKEIRQDSVPPGATQGRNDFGNSKWGGPCPPGGTHRYRFKLYALGTRLKLPEGASEPELVKAMEGKVLERAELVGTYTRKR